MTKDMTEGAIPSLLVGFTIPLVLGNLFQLLYNAVDSMIVGKFVGETALAAVGTSSPLMTLAILFISGMCMGAGVLMGMHYGAKDYDVLERQISSTMIGGLMFSFIYNFYASTLRALGDSRSPLYFLMISAALNVAGDLFFVVVLGWGSNGCAFSTVLSEALCCLLCGLYIKKKVKILCLGRKWRVFDRRLFYKTVQFGWVSAMQQATVQLGKIGIQAIVNTMGISVMAAFAVVNRIDDFAYTPEQNIAHAMTALLAQNKGAGKKERIREGFRCGLWIEMIYALFICVVCFVFARPLMKLFVTDEEVISLGVIYLHAIAVMYFLPAATNGIQGYFRGMGDLKVTLSSSFINMGVRVAAAVPLVFSMKLGIVALPVAYLIGWLAMLAAETPLLFRRKE